MYISFWAGWRFTKGAIKSRCLVVEKIKKKCGEVFFVFLKWKYFLTRISSSQHHANVFFPEEHTSVEWWKYFFFLQNPEPAWKYFFFLRITSTHQHFNTSTHQHISTSTHQHVSTHQHNHHNINTTINTISTHHQDRHINTSKHQHVNTSTRQHQHTNESTQYQQINRSTQSRYVDTSTH